MYNFFYPNGGEKNNYIFVSKVKKKQNKSLVVKRNNKCRLYKKTKYIYNRLIIITVRILWGSRFVVETHKKVVSATLKHTQIKNSVYLKMGRKNLHRFIIHRVIF